jgi:hypothetical protein
MFYREKFGDSIDAQNERHTKSRQTERIRGTKDIYENGKTCPEETVYQLGTKDGSADPALFVTMVTELFEEIQKRFGSNVQILDWALNMDEETPHIHERHVFYADDGYGMLFPKQEKACEELGFERPDPERKHGKNNNRKKSYDEEIPETVKHTLSSPVTRKKNEEEIRTTARISLHNRLKRAQMQVAENNVVCHNTLGKRKEQSL